MNVIISKLEKLGYIVTTDMGTEIFEPFTSDVTGEKNTVSIAYSSEDNNMKFLIECLSTLEAKIKNKK